MSYVFAHISAIAYAGAASESFGFSGKLHVILEKNDSPYAKKK